MLLLVGNTLLPRSTRCCAAARYRQSAFALHVPGLLFVTFRTLPRSNTPSHDPGMGTTFWWHEVDFKTSAPLSWCQPKPRQHPRALGCHSQTWALPVPMAVITSEANLDKTHPITGMTGKVMQSCSTLLVARSLNLQHTPSGICFKSIRKTASDFMQISA